MLPNGTRFHINDVLYYIANAKEICSSLKKYVEMDITLKPRIKVIQNVFILPILFMGETRR